MGDARGEQCDVIGREHGHGGTLICRKKPIRVQQKMENDPALLETYAHKVDYDYIYFFHLNSRDISLKDVKVMDKKESLLHTCLVCPLLGK